MNNSDSNVLLYRVLSASVLKDFSLLSFIGLIALVDIETVFHNKNKVTFEISFPRCAVGAGSSKWDDDTGKHECEKFHHYSFQRLIGG